MSIRSASSPHDTACAASEVSPASLTDDHVYWIGEDRVLIWSSEDDAENDDGANALRMVGWPDDLAEIERILRESDATEI